MGSRIAMFAGSWYPSDASQCEQQIQEFISEIPAPTDQKPPFVGGIVPHAGWYFSGAVACRVIQLLSEGPRPDALLLFGMHLRPHAANHIMTTGSWQTPFGDIEIAEELALALAREFPFKIETVTDFSPDNTIELQLPFIKYFLDGVPIVPIGVPPAAASIAIGTRAASMAGEMGLSLKALGSTDLTHYGANYGFSPHGTGEKAAQWVRDKNDREMVTAMEDMDPDRVLEEAASRLNACCAGAVAATISASKSLGATRGHTVHYTTSYDKSPGDSLVGYAGVVFQ
jgi:AmmeMemoRadiSam system protein B